jgi:ferredoxin
VSSKPPPPKHEPSPQLRLKACVVCGCVITTGGLCSYDCPHDAIDSPTRLTLTYVYRHERTLGLPKAPAAKDEEEKEE